MVRYQFPPFELDGRRFRFGPFELDGPDQELRKGSIRIRIQNQPFQVLRTLVERAGEVVTREELRQTVWSHDTFVDFEHGLNAAMNKVRQALGDSADHPFYIETMPGQGYRFVAPVEKPAVAPVETPLASTAAARAPVERHHLLLPVKKWMAVAAAGTAFGIWGVVTLLTAKPGSIPRPVLQFVISPPPGIIFAPPISRQPFAISPDGKRLAFTATGLNGTNVWIRDLASLEMRTVPGTEGAWVVFWSPDSRSIFYSVKRSLKEADLETGSTRAVANLPFITMFGTWRSKGDLLLYLGPHTFYELQIENGALRELPGADMRWPQFLPHSNNFIHIVFDPALRRYRALATDYFSHKSVPLMETDSRVQYAPPLRRGDPGYLLFIREASLLAQPFDADRVRLAGDSFPIVQNVIYFRPSPCFSVSDNGVLVYQTGFPVSELNWYDRAGHILSAAGRPMPYSGTVRISPDGRRAAAGVWSPDNGGLDIWVFESSGTGSRRLTYPPAVHGRPVWSADGKRIAFGTSLTGPPALASLEAAGDGKEQQVITDSAQSQAIGQIQMPTDWSRNGRFIAFDTGLGEEEQEVWLADTAGGNVMPLLRREFAQWGAVFSPDGGRIAFVSEESGRPEVYVQAFDSVPSPRLVGERRQVSSDGAWIARWRPDGRELFYVSTSNWLHAVPVEAPLEFGEPKPLFRIAGIPQYGTTSDFQFDVTRDGRRFIMSTTGSVAPPPFTVIENWQDKFRR